jgi:hypothetical protein
MTIEILKPMYNGASGKRELTLADYRVANEGEVVQVSIKQTYKNKKKPNYGKLIYPNLLCMRKTEVQKYPLVQINKEPSHVIMGYKMPLEDFVNKKFDLKEAQYYKPKEKPKVEQGSLF